MKTKLTAIALLICIMISVLAGCSSQSAPKPDENNETAVTEPAVTEPAAPADVSLDALPTISVKSAQLENGVWNDSVAKHHDNKSPQLEWEAVDGAACYAVYFVDYSASGWMHMKATGITKTSLDEGEIGSPKKKDNQYCDGYVGPFPPSTHTYVMYVVALRESLEQYPGITEQGILDQQAFLNELDTAPDGSRGNILAIGTISGDYT